MTFHPLGLSWVAEAEEGRPAQADHVPWEKEPSRPTERSGPAVLCCAPREWQLPLESSGELLLVQVSGRPTYCWATAMSLLWGCLWRLLRGSAMLLGWPGGQHTTATRCKAQGRPSAHSCNSVQPSQLAHARAGTFPRGAVFTKPHINGSEGALNRPSPPQLFFSLWC